jgi:beta-glucosidase
MRTPVETRRQRKAAVVAEVAADKALKKQRAAELAAMPPAERTEAKAADRAAAKAAAAQRKAEIKAMPRAERKAAKRHDRMYRKVWHRPRRAVVWVAVLLVLALIATTVAPYVRDISRMLSISIDSSTPAGEAARAQGALIAEEISDEGIVLLQNDAALLPLSDQGVNVFGFSSYTMRFGGGGSGGADQSASKDLFQGLEEAGVAYNEDLHAFMRAEGAGESAGASNGLVQILWSALTGGGDEPHEPDIAYLTDEAIAQAQSFSDVALVVMGNDGVEMQDFTVEQLRITDNQRALLDRVTGAFDNVILVVNSGNVMELGFLDEYPQIRSALWIGTPGPKGTVSLGKVLSGEVNPSGRLTSTYAYDVSSNPASENFGNYRYDNIDGRGLLEYEEGIYVGYRYYETRYQGDEAAYAEAVQFPFGHGLSYTTFEREASEPTITDETVTVEVEVTNTGAVAGKDVVQVYFSAPWTEGGLEKSAVELAGYAKTSLLAPGASETVTVEFPLRDMASWDMTGQAYVLEQGAYEVKVGGNVHTFDATFPHEVVADVVFDADEVTGTALEGRFDYADGGLTYLSRADWEGTWPTSDDIELTAPQELLDAMAAEIPVADGEVPTVGADNGIQLADLKGLDYDDPAWEQFLDQFTLDELMNLFSRGAYQTYGVERLGVPESILLDGPAGINFLFGQVTAASYPTQVVIASTWNDDLARRMGETVGDEANAYGVHGWYAPGMNLHRTAQGGRNFEYFSEDPLLSGKMGAAMTAGAQSRDVLVFMKHFLLNDQEVNARSGVHVWANEQAIRELYLRPFEITVKEADATGAMSSFVHIGHKWSGGNPELLQDVLRGEWGFDGVVSTDAVLGGFMDNRLAVRNGNDLMLDVLSPSGNIRQLEKAYEEDPVGIGEGLRDRVHTLCYSLLQTTLFR